MDTSNEFVDYSNVTRNPDYNPFQQYFWIHLDDGQSQVETNVVYIDLLLKTSVYQAIAQAAQVGAATVLLAAIFLMTKSEKRRSSVFCLNAISLVLIVLRGIFQLNTLTGPLYEWYRWNTHRYIDMGNSKVISAFAGVWGFLLTIAILLSLFVQVRIVCCNLSDARRYIVNISNAIVIAVAIAMSLAVTILNICWDSLELTPAEHDRFQTIGRLASAANITLVLSIAFSTIIFTAKLASAILARRSMGMKQFGPMQIIFVMGCQTMFTPLIFTIITYTSIKDANVQSFVPTIVAVSLPLSGMWAAVNTDNVHIANPDSRKRRVIPLGASDNTYSGSSSKGPSTNTSTYYDDDKYGLTAASPKKAGRVDTEPDLEMQRIGDGVNVERSYSVRSD